MKIYQLTQETCMRLGFRWPMMFSNCTKACLDKSNTIEECVYESYVARSISAVTLKYKVELLSVIDVTRPSARSRPKDIEFFLL